VIFRLIPTAPPGSALVTTTPSYRRRSAYRRKSACAPLLVAAREAANADLRRPDGARDARRRTFAPLLLCLLVPLLLPLASCGDLPEPFLGNPGATARALAQPPTARIAVPAPTNALLPDNASRQLAAALTAGLQAQEVPAVDDQMRKTDWQLITTAEQRGSTVVPVFSVLNPLGQNKGKAEGTPVPTQSNRSPPMPRRRLPASSTASRPRCCAPIRRACTTAMPRWRSRR
jgi:hypothetical protein